MKRIFSGLGLFVVLASLGVQPVVSPQPTSAQVTVAPNAIIDDFCNWFPSLCPMNP